MALGSNMKGKSKKPSGVVEEIKQSRSEKKKAAPTSKKKVSPKPKPKVVSKRKTAVKAKKSPVDSSKPVVSQKPAQAENQEKEIKTVDQPKVDLSALKNARLVLEPSKRRKIRKTKVFLEGDLNINNVEAFAEQIKPIFNDYDYVDFVLREVTSLDLCYIQLLFHFQRFKKDKTVTIDSNISPEMKKVVINAGFEELMFIPKLV